MSVIVGTVEVVGVAEIVCGVDTTIVKIVIGDAQGVPTSWKSVVIIIQACCDCSDMIAAARLWAPAGGSVIKESGMALTIV